MAKNLSAEQVYERNKKLAKKLKILAPVCFWGFLALSFICLFFAIRNSFGNIAEIINLLDKNKYTGDQLRENYNYLLGKYGEWVIGDGNKGFVLTFVNIGNALFSGIMIANCFLFVLCLFLAFALGKLILPRLSNQIIEDNQDMVNLTILREKDKE